MIKGNRGVQKSYSCSNRFPKCDEHTIMLRTKFQGSYRVNQEVWLKSHIIGFYEIWTSSFCSKWSKNKFWSGNLFGSAPIYLEVQVWLAPPMRSTEQYYNWASSPLTPFQDAAFHYCTFCNSVIQIAWWYKQPEGSTKEMVFFRNISLTRGEGGRFRYS